MIPRKRARVRKKNLPVCSPARFHGRLGHTSLVLVIAQYALVHPSIIFLQRSDSTAAVFHIRHRREVPTRTGTT